MVEFMRLSDMNTVRLIWMNLAGVISGSKNYQINSDFCRICSAKVSKQASRFFCEKALNGSLIIEIGYHQVYIHKTVF